MCIAAGMLTICVSSYAQTSGGMTTEVEIASYIVLCEAHAKTHSPQDLSFWREAKTEVDAADLLKAQRSIGAVDVSLSQVDPTLIEMRCRDFKNVWEDPEGADYEEPSDELQAITTKVQDTKLSLSDQMAAANFAPDNLNIVLKYLVNISNDVPDRMKAGLHMERVLLQTKKSLSRQRVKLSSDHAADVLSAQNPRGLYICYASAMLKASQTFEAQQYAFSDQFMTEKILWAALINRNRKPGENLVSDEVVAQNIPASVNNLLNDINFGRPISLQAQSVVNKAEDTCLTAVSPKIIDQYITLPIFSGRQSAK